MSSRKNVLLNNRNVRQFADYHGLSREVVFSAKNQTGLRMAQDAIRPFYDDPFIGHLSTPISNSSFTNSLLGNLPAYRKGLSARLRGLEIGMAHGYFLVGPFVSLGPLRNSESGLIAGTLSAVGLIVILTLCLELYGRANFSGSKAKAASLWESGEGWNDFVGGWLIGGVGSVGFAYILLQFFF
eukprot:CAMPEP_0196651606 /NCGR_PEP_ID=MMETSP1086-20130531/633_1 /TAXON_ID=77921 /ORGANISM="Cyanoptyche  gloeocystis , Strain SAG4.97" /LENGTH=183 /DNA_ID=CAMNT_0041981697 /DNA_START=162 /DNA_END=713 /DNA_ORIENTATION=+